MTDQLDELTREDKNMSGGGGTAGSSRDIWHPKTSGAGRGETDCDITEYTNLNSPNPTVVETLKINDILTIDLDDRKPVRLVAKTDDGKIAGTITSKLMRDIAECIQKGFEYEAEIQLIDNGLVKVWIRQC